MIDNNSTERGICNVNGLPCSGCCPVCGSEKTLYNVLKSEINNWPDWKKKAYNDNFANSAHAIKVEVNQDDSKIQILNHELNKYQSAFYQACEQLALLNDGQNSDWINYFMRRVEGHLYE